MDIEDLTKSQIILLTLLVSFMTSIATGIVTVSLMQQAPPTVVQSVNRIIRQTVGQVASTTARITQPAASAAATEVKTVIVRDSDTISQAVAIASRSVVRVYAHDAASPRFLGIGIIADSSGLVITDESAIGEYANVDVKRADGSLTRAFVTGRDTAHGVAYLTQATSTTPVVLGEPALFAKTSVKLGDMIVVISGVTVDHIRAGFATTLLSSADTGTVAVVETDIPKSGVLPGTPLIDATGNMIGISTGISRAVSEGSFLPIGMIKIPFQ
ncbi:trypsin-like peptidase domain-containing protein [Candidatus Kaiserbacteria bacterium]|nr:trypsin-like peptidase domain-containing protein [Candidatus Kaiserbacteria bacterium]